VFSEILTFTLDFAIKPVKNQPKPVKVLQYTLIYSTHIVYHRLWTSRKQAHDINM